MNYMRLKRRQWPWILFLSVLGYIWMIPLIYMVSMSLRTSENAFDPALFILPLTLHNYKRVILENPLHIHLFISLIISLSSVVIVTLGAAMAAFGFTRKDVKFKKILYGALLSTLMVPISAIVIPLTQLNASMGWLNTIQGLIFPYSALGIPFALVILKGFMDAVPRDLEDAAVIDGCGNWRLFFQIILAMLKHGIIVVVIWEFLTCWNEFFLALVTMSEQMMKPLPLIPMQYSGMYFSRPNALFAILVLVSIPMIVFYIIMSKRFIQGLTSGAIKG
ncbi:MAG: carbohydrate ABC transporter permease [Spirochaetaceae bacterium]|jgi:raffinose/stachyose/melibiose transport system permease protein|nr:carbohydrate ABC transporter permease [Spirochaetaceae bacterium]